MQLYEQFFHNLRLDKMVMFLKSISLFVPTQAMKSLLSDHMGSHKKLDHTGGSNYTINEMS